MSYTFPPGSAMPLVGVAPSHFYAQRMNDSLDSLWVLNDALEVDPAGMPTVDSGFTLGNGTTSFSRFRLSGTCWFEGVITLGSTSSVSGNIALSGLTPSPTASYLGLAAGSVALYDSSANRYYPGSADMTGAGVLTIHGNATNLTSGFPFPWGTGDKIMVRGEVRQTNRIGTLQ